jgi:hypothetical protein
MKKPLFGTRDFDGILAHRRGLSEVRFYTRAFRLHYALFQPISQVWADKPAENYLILKENNSEEKLQLA